MEQLIARESRPFPGQRANRPPRSCLVVCQMFYLLLGLFGLVCLFCRIAFGMGVAGVAIIAQGVSWLHHFQ